jgi:hypothetical protein
MTTTTDGLCPSCYRELQRTDYERSQCGSCGWYLADKCDAPSLSGCPDAHIVLGPLYQLDEDDS